MKNTLKIAITTLVSALLVAPNLAFSHENGTRVHDRLQRQLEALREQAVAALVRAIARHGLQGLEVYPADAIGTGRFGSTNSNFMGVTLASTGLRLPDEGDMAAPANPSPEGRACQAVFRQLLLCAAELAGVSGAPPSRPVRTPLLRRAADRRGHARTHHPRDRDDRRRPDRGYGTHDAQAHGDRG